jgi:hypothetical protein
MQVSDLFNRPPSISEDTLHYELYSPDEHSDKTAVSALALAIHTFVEESVQGFHWHRDSFELKVQENEEKGRWHLEGDMRVGDAVDDEWCVVWLLREISTRWDVAIRYVAITIYMRYSDASIRFEWLAYAKDRNLGLKL